MNEANIKALVMMKLIRQKRASPGSVVASEFAIFGTKTRADLAILGARTFVGIEIKSSADSLRRLDRQLGAYNQVFDRVILVLASNHYASFSKDAFPQLEVWELEETGRLSIRQKSNGQTGARGDFCYTPYLTCADRKRLACSATPDESSTLRKAFLFSFKKKFRQSSDAFWDHVGSEVTTADIECLSRFRERRQRNSKWIMAQSDRWTDWLNALAQIDFHQSSQTSSVS